MGIHGHGSLPVRLEKTATATFLASDIEFIMPGPWEVRLFFLKSATKNNSCDSEVEDLNPASVIELKEVPVEI
jgi:hypothetical protein